MPKFNIHYNFIFEGHRVVEAATAPEARVRFEALDSAELWPAARIVDVKVVRTIELVDDDTVLTIEMRVAHALAGLFPNLEHAWGACDAFGSGRYPGDDARAAWIRLARDLWYGATGRGAAKVRLGALVGYGLFLNPTAPELLHLRRVLEEMSVTQ